MFTKVDENFNYAQTLEKLIKIDKLSENIIYLDQDVKKYQKTLDNIREVQRNMLEGKVHPSGNYYYSLDSSNHEADDSLFFVKLPRKDVVMQLEKDHMENKKKLAEKQKLLDNLLNIFTKQYKYEDYSYLGTTFVNLIELYIRKVNDELDIDN